MQNNLDEDDGFYQGGGIVDDMYELDDEQKKSQ